ncbi:MAG: hypothetical protein KF788_08860 [Piscinibacter sp.]|nr:hypothetical protein [Piscinibacter sp.]
MTEDLTAFFTDFAESVTIAGAAKSAIVDTSTELVLGDVLTHAPTLLLPAAEVPTVAEGAACVVRGAAHSVRQVLQEPPDGALVRLVLVRS